MLQVLVATIQTSWGSPETWSCEQYDQLVQSIQLAQEKMGGNTAATDANDSVLGTACALRYAFEAIPENQQKLLLRQSQAESATLSIQDPVVPGGRIRCPTIYSYFSTFERLSLGVRDSSDSTTDLPLIEERGSATSVGSARSSGTAEGPLTPRSATLAKYAHMYLEEEGRHRAPWSWERVEGDDLLELVTDAAASRLAERFDQDRVYSYLGDHTLLFTNPNRVLKTTKFTSIYDEHVVLVYDQTPFATTYLAPHPFAMAKQALTRCFLNGPATPQSIVLQGESGAGKTELSKELLKYVVLTAQPPQRQEPKIKVFTSSTKSTLQMRSEETRSLDLLHAKSATTYELVLLDLETHRWSEMTDVSHSKRLPQVHIEGKFFGFFETLQRLEDEEQLRMYVRNPHVAHKLSSILDCNLLLEAFGHATTSMNPNSSRYGRVVELQLSFEEDASHFQVIGCKLTPCLLERTRVTKLQDAATAKSKDLNFHVFYAVVAAASVLPEWQQTLCLDKASTETFAYLGKAQRQLSVASMLSSGNQLKVSKRDIERFQNLVRAMDSIKMTADQQQAVFRVVSAILWLGNIEFTTDTATGAVRLSGNAPSSRPVADIVSELLRLPSVASLETMLLSRQVALPSTGEVFEVVLGQRQAQNVRDTLARMLYDSVFSFVIAIINNATDAPLATSSQETASRRCLRIVDMPGFEALEINSYEQLCVNYLTEKLGAMEQQLAEATLKPVNEAAGDEVVSLLEHSLGLWATLEEQTVLHQREHAKDEREQHKKDQVFVRYLYQRNATRPALVTVPPQLGTLCFSICHSRDTVMYDASDFVRKNSDFRFPSLYDGLAQTNDEWIRRMIVQRSDYAEARGSVVGSGTSATQVRAQIQRVLGAVHSVDQPHTALFLHCFRPNESGWSSRLDDEVLAKQMRAHRIDSLTASHKQRISDGASAAQVDRTLFQTRYRSLVVAPVAGDLEGMCEALTKYLNEEDARVGPKIHLHGDRVLIDSIGTIERLELLLLAKRTVAATTIQAFFRMWRIRQWYSRLQSDRRVLVQDLMDIYGPNSTRKIEKTLRKYQDRLEELRTRIAAKKTEKAYIADLSMGIGAFMKSGAGRLDTNTWEEVLRDEGVQRLLHQDDRVVVALREVSLNPEALVKQLSDPVLRDFYERVLHLLQSKQAAEAAQSAVDSVGDASLDDRIRRVVSTHKTQWLEHARHEMWAEIQDRLEEIGEQPEMLVFYQDDENFISQISAFVRHVESSINSNTPTTSGSEDDERRAATVALLQRLAKVEFNASLMAAMQGDPFFVDALQAPETVTAVHQFMADRDGFAARANHELSPVVFEFFSRLVALAGVVQRRL
ncbi:hypothetical protein PINS_up008421 [Pythium insidiosum]|nr:hypothetical protein PINS_up008421 [Pythium insidiosum]